MSVLQLPVVARVRLARALGHRRETDVPGVGRRSGADRYPGPARTIIEGVAAVLLLGVIVGGVGSVLAWAAAQVLLLAVD